jgi:hypothetical protein
MDRGILAKAAKAVAARTGETFRDKQIVGLRSLGQGRTKSGEGKEIGELVTMVAVHAKQQTEATISLSTEALWTASITAGNAGYLNPEHKDVQKCILSALQRNFTNESFKLHLYVPQIPGTPTTAALAKAFGEANECKLDATITTHTTADEDRFYYTYLQRALQALQVVVTPDLDVGFASEVHWFADNITAFVANGTPMCMVTRAISRCFLQAQRQRNQELMFADESGEEMLCFKDTSALAASKRRLSEWNRDAQIDQQIQWDRCYEQATGQSAGAHDTARKGAHGGRGGNGGSTEQQFAQHMKMEGGGGGRQAMAKSSTMDINFNKIDKTKWMREYGETRVDGKVVLMCWYNCNRPGGCVRQTECVHNHKVLPTAYKGKTLEKCTPAFQKEVLRKCGSA